MFRDILMTAATAIASRLDPAATKAASGRSRKMRRKEKYPRTASAAEREVLRRAINEIAEHIDDGGVALEGTNDDWAAYEARITDKPSVSPDSVPTRFTVWRRIAPETHREAVGEHNVQMHYATDTIGSEHLRRISVSIYRTGDDEPLINGYSPSRVNVLRLPRSKPDRSGKLLNEVLRLVIKVFLRTDRGDLRALPLFLKNLRTWVRQHKKIHVVVTGTSISIFLGACYAAYYYYASHHMQIAVAKYYVEGSSIASIIRWDPQSVSGPYSVIKNGMVVGETAQTYFVDTSSGPDSAVSTRKALYRVSGYLGGLPIASLAWSADDRVKKSEPCIVDGRADLCVPMFDLGKVVALPFDRFAEVPPIVAIVGRPVLVSITTNMIREGEGERITLDRDRSGLPLHTPIDFPATGTTTTVANGDQLQTTLTFDKPGLFPVKMRLAPSNTLAFERLVRVYSEAEILRDAQMIVDSRGDAAYQAPDIAPLVVWDAPGEVTLGPDPLSVNVDRFSPHIEVSRRSLYEPVRFSLGIASSSGNEVLIDYGDGSGLLPARTYVPRVDAALPRGLVGHSEHRYGPTVDTRGHSLTISARVYEHDQSSGARRLVRVVRKHVTL
jgi:hypothetical protein